MVYKINWDIVAIESYIEESEFILSKWNLKEVAKFELLVEIELNRISKNPTIGNFKYKNVYSLMISKQTAVYYRVNNKKYIVEIIVFWNNLKNPEDLIKLL